MTEVTQVPGELDIKAKKGDDLTLTFDQSNDMTGFTMSAAVVTNQGTIVPMTVTEVAYATGQFTITLADTDFANIEIGVHNWYCDRTNAGNQRRYWEGKFICV